MPQGSLDPKKALALRVSEPAILDRLKSRLERGPAHDVVVIPDEEGEPEFSFGIHALDDTIYQRLDRMCRRSRRDEETGMELQGELDVSAYRTAVILEATDTDDRNALWRNPELRQMAHVATENQLVDKLLGGLKLAVVLRIDALGRYNQPLPKVEKLEQVLGDLSEPAES